MKKILNTTCIAVLLLTTSCKQSQTALQRLDLWGFRLFGQSLLSDTGYVRIKEVHLNNRVLLGKPVIVAGTLQRVGAQHTYLVMADKSAKLVVDLTKLSAAERARLDNTRQDPTRLKVFGVVGINNKGHPHLLAKALRPLDNTSS